MMSYEEKVYLNKNQIAVDLQTANINKKKFHNNVETLKEAYTLKHITSLH